MTAALLLLFAAGGTPAAPPQAPPVLRTSQAPPQAPPVRQAARYPVRGSWWTGCPNWQHMTQGEHRGKFPAEWLKQLTWDELQSLHSDDHEGRVRWQYVPGGCPGG